MIVVLGFLAGAIVVGALFIMTTMEAGSRSTGGRFYVALGALALLGWLVGQGGWWVKRKAPLTFGTPPEVRRYSLVSLLLLVCAAVILLGFALLRP